MYTTWYTIDVRFSNFFFLKKLKNQNVLWGVHVNLDGSLLRELL